jgi:hypothetical protein
VATQALLEQRDHRGFLGKQAVKLLAQSFGLTAPAKGRAPDAQPRDQGA